jgi:hypothetical protein
MIGKIMSEVSHSIIGMLSAKPVDMETQLPKFDLNSLLTSSDDQYAAVLGQNNIKQPGDQNELRFLDQLAENGVHVQVGSKSLDKTDTTSAEQPSPKDLGDSSDIVSFLSESNEVLAVSKTPTSEGPHFSNPAVAKNSDSKETEAESKQLIAQPIRKLVSMSFDEWETGFASSTMLDDNFSAVESAIAKYRLPVVEPGQTPNTPIPVHGQDGVQNPPVSSTETSDAESSGDFTTVPDQESKPSMTTTGPVSHITTTGEIDDNGSATQLIQSLAKSTDPDSAPQPYLVLDQVNTSQSSASISPYAAINLELVGINHESKDRIGKASNATPVTSKAPSTVSTHVFDQPDNFLPRDGQSSRHENRSAPLMDLSSELSNKFVEGNPSKSDLTQKPRSMASMEVGKPSPGNSEQAHKQPAPEVLGSERLTPFSNGKNAQAPRMDDLEPALAKHDEKQLAAPKIGRSSLQRDQSVSPKDLAQSAPIETHAETIRSSVAAVPSNVLNRQPEDKKTAPRGVAREMPRATEASELEKPVQEPRILDSINLRLSNKIEVDRPLGTRSETDLPASNTGVEKQAAANLELPAASVEKSVPITTPVHLLNIPTSPTVHKTVNFDWNSPQFAERFAAEISDLSTNGDLKRFEINPRNLGRLEVAFVARGGTEFIRIEAESQAARDAIVQHSQVIQDMLKAQGRSDLTIRVDIKDQGFSSASDNSGLNFAQQDETGPRDDRPKSQSRGVSTLSSDIGIETDVQRDEGRYA